jgi:hypothetical protein
VDQWLKKRSDITAQLQEVEDQYKKVSSQLQEVKATLARTKENVTLSELIASEGMKEMISTLNIDIQEMLDQEKVIDNQIFENSGDLKQDNAQKKEIVAFYKARMKQYLNDLNVGVLSENDYKTLDKQIKNNALGSDLPRALLAQYFAFLGTMSHFNSFVLCPILIDSPFQQEQDPTNRKAILDFIVSNRLQDQQMILATVSIDEFSDNANLENATRHKLDEKLSVLRRDSYQSVLAEIDSMHREALASAN